ncbi:hypothetical protein [Scytonema sp. HK-05]|uniref:hypothetical protein n=1 Tax=Scytonema sp. HK-05 TaxID=1137095 RepID=UPI0013011826|nr:hypothetical protein [Scytonema sp. HK-05]
MNSEQAYGGGFKPALRVRHLLYLGKPQDRSGSPPTLSVLLVGDLNLSDETDN